ASIRLVRESAKEGRTLRGADVDDAARHVIESRGFGHRFSHRTGHCSYPRSLHGAGPHLDNLETREERRLIPGVGFSIEPGVYLPGEFGMRSEVNAFFGASEAVITPVDYQRDLIIVGPTTPSTEYEVLGTWTGVRAPGSPVAHSVR